MQNRLRVVKPAPGIQKANIRELLTPLKVLDLIWNMIQKREGKIISNKMTVGGNYQMDKANTKCSETW